MTMAGKRQKSETNAKAAASAQRETTMQGDTAKRWAKLAADPRFGRIDRNKTKVEIDDRFKAMLEDSDFTGEGSCSLLSSSRRELASDSHSIQVKWTNEDEKWRRKPTTFAVCIASKKTPL